MFDKDTAFDVVPSDVCMWVDKGFQGIQHQHKNTMQPKKKPQNREFTAEENDALSRATRPRLRLSLSRSA